MQDKPINHTGIRLLISQNCPHCNSLIQTGVELLKAGQCSRLDIINIESPPPGLDIQGIRSVPVMFIEGLSFEGLHTRGEILYWLEHAHTQEGIRKYIDENLKLGKIVQVRNLLQTHSEHLPILTELLGTPDTSLHTRIGISTLLEELAGTETLKSLFSKLAELTTHQEANIRGDACYLLALTEMPEARKYLEARLEDQDPSVREIASEGLDELS